MLVLMVKELLSEDLFAAVLTATVRVNEGCSVAGEIVYPACVSYDKDTSLVVAGFCPAALWKNFHRLTLPYNDSVCDPSNRTGTLCGSCMANKSVMRTNSEELRCVPDSECCHFWSWLLYIASYLITTLMLIIVVIFQPQLVSPKFTAVMLAAQLIAVPSNLHMLRVKSAGVGVPLFVKIFIKLIYFLYHIWNLDSTGGTIRTSLLLLSPKHSTHTSNGLPACHLHTDTST